MSEANTAVEWGTDLPRCKAAGCDELADWVYVGKGGDLYLCVGCGGTEPVEGWQWIGE